MQNDKRQNSSFVDYTTGDDEIHLLDILIVLVRHKKMISFFCLTAFILVSGITLLLPDFYSATARILPREEKDGGFYVNMLEGPEIADGIIDRFGLLAAHQAKSRSSVYPILNNQVTFFEGKKDHVITITVEDKNPKRAAEMANAYVEELRKVSDQNYLKETSALRKYLEGRLEVVKENLARAEQNLKAFQGNNKPIQIDDQTKATIEVIARLKGELASKEIELRAALRAKREQISPNITLHGGFEQIKSQITAVEESPIGDKIPSDVKLVSSVGSDLGLQYAGMLRDFRMQVTLLELLTRQYEIARIEELKTPPEILVLKTALIPSKKIRPQRSLIVLLSVIVAGILGGLTAFVCEYGEQMSDEDRKRWKVIIDSLRLPGGFGTR